MAALNEKAFYEAHAIPTPCGSNAAWVKITGGMEPYGQRAQGCVCHGAPAELDLDTGSLLPREVWTVVDARGSQSFYATREEAIEELRYLDNKYRPAYLMRSRINAHEVQAVQRFSADVAGDEDTYQELG